MTLVDAGPLVALIDADEVDHDRCVDTLARLRPPLLTTWPAVTEAMHLLTDAGGWHAQERLWGLLLAGGLTIHALSERTTQRTFELMKQYRDVPMDLGDASLVAVAEELNDRTVFTLDSDFLIYRLRGRTGFTVVPS